MSDIREIRPKKDFGDQIMIEMAKKKEEKKGWVCVRVSLGSLFRLSLCCSSRKEACFLQFLLRIDVKKMPQSHVIP